MKQKALWKEMNKVEEVAVRCMFAWAGERTTRVFAGEMSKLLGASLLILWLQSDCELWEGGLNIVEECQEQCKVGS